MKDICGPTCNPLSTKIQSTSWTSKQDGAHQGRNSSNGKEKLWLVNITLRQPPSLLQRTTHTLMLGPCKAQDHLREQANGNSNAVTALLPPCLGRSPGSQAGCPQELGVMAEDAMGGTAPFCSHHFSPFKNSTPVPGSSIPGSLPFTFSLLKLSLGRNIPAWSPIRGTTKLGFAYVLEKP